MKKVILMCLVILCMTSVVSAVEVEQEIEVEVINEEDNNAFLSNLYVVNGNFEPAFSKEQLSYSMTVPNDVTEVEIIAEPESEYAQILYIQGNRNLKEGENKALIDVQAENGDILTYTIAILRTPSEANTEQLDIEESAQPEENINIPMQEKSDVEITYNGTTYKVKSYLGDIDIPEGFYESTLAIDEKEVTSIASDIYDFQIVFAKKPGQNDYDMYAVENSGMGKCVLLESYNAPIFTLTAPEDVFADDYVPCQIEIEGKVIDAYQKTEGFNNLYYFYGANQEGENKVFIYDSDTKIIEAQTDFEEENQEIELINNDSVVDIGHAAITVLVIAAIAAVLIIVILIKNFFETE